MMIPSSWNYDLFMQLFLHLLSNFQWKEGLLREAS